MADRRRPMRRRGGGAATVDEPSPAENFTAEVRLFAWLAELAQARSVTVELNRETRAETVIAQALKAAGLGDGAGVTGCTRLAVNHEYAEPGATVNAGDELALIPPVSGGAPPHVRVGSEPIELTLLHELVTTSRTGAVVTLTGCAHGADEVHFESYEEMADTRIRCIADQLLQRYKLEAVAIEHRIGELTPGQPTVVVAVSAVQPPPAFAAAREAIDRIKAEVPIWRLERDGDYRSWDRGDPLSFLLM
jgi:MoaE-MoaD fusion protein